MQKIDIGNWPRRNQYLFFRQFEEPFFGVTVNVNCSLAYQYAKQAEDSFFLHYLYCALRAVNEVEAFRYRIVGDDVMLYDDVHVSAVINRPNGTFGFSYIDYSPSFSTFKESAVREIEKVRSTTGLVPAVSGENVIHCSSIPWLDFTSLSHARSFQFSDSCPKISFGKMTTKAGESTMPVSIHVHHALMDGFHVAQFVDRFQELLNLPLES